MDFVRTVPPEFTIGDGLRDEPLNEDTLVENQLQLKDDIYCRESGVRVMCGSWNISQRKPEPVAALAEWIGLAPANTPPTSPATAETVHVDPTSPIAMQAPAGIIAIGLQEVDMSANALLREETENSKPWIEAFVAAAGPQYQKIASRQLAGLLILVLARVELVGQITDAASAIVRCGAMGNSIANKGAVGVRLLLNKTSFCFTTAHLAAHQNESEKRNRDFTRIMENMQFPCGEQLLEHDRIFFFGDLNYRLDLTYEEATALTKKNDIAKLLLHDQLEQQDHLFCNIFKFKIPKPTFPPTYKYDPGTWDYDTSEKRRIPSWTDRILWRSRKGGVTLREFAHNESLLSSDHRAVGAVFDTKVLREDPETKRSVREEILQTIREVGTKEFAVQQIELSKSEINFGDVVYGQIISQDVTVTNKGHGVVLVKLHMCCDDPTRKSRAVSSNASSWISVSALQARIAPGASEVFTIKCCVAHSVIGGLAPGLLPPPFDNETPGCGKIDLNQSLIFSTGPTQRFWFETKARYTPSCFGSSLTHLSLLGLIPMAKAYTMCRDDQPPAPRKPQIPKELWWLVDYLIRNGKQTPQLFQSDLNMEAFEVIREHLDGKCESLPTHPLIDACSVSQVLLVFLQHLQEPLLPSKHYERLFGENASPQFIPPRDLHLPPPHFNSFTYMIAFLRFLLRPDNKSLNKLTPELLAQGFAPALFQPPPFYPSTTPEQDDNERVKKTKYLLQLLKG